MSSLHMRKQLFALQPFRFYALSCALAMIGNGISYIAMTWMVLALHNTITSVVILMFTFWLPSVFLGPFAGVIVDRSSKKTLYVWMNAIRGLLLLALGFVVMFHPSLFALYSFSFFQGIEFSFVLPVVVSLIREIVSKDQLLVANTTIDIAYEVGNVLGMALAGVAVALLHNSGALIFTGLLFVVAAFVGAKMQVVPTSVQKRSLAFGAVMRDLFEGLRYVMVNKHVRVIYSIQLTIMVAFMTVPVLSAPFATHLLHANVTQFGVIEAMLSVGVIAGGMFVPSLASRFGLRLLLIVLLIGLSVCYVLFSENRNIHVAYGLNLVIGFGLAVWPLIMTRAQDLTDMAYQGRVQSAFNCLSGVLILLVYVVVNYGSHFFSLAHLYYVEVIFSALGLLLLLSHYHSIAKPG